MLSKLTDRARDGGLRLSTRPPFASLSRYNGRRRMLKALGPDLASEVTWRRSPDNNAPEGELASIVAATTGIHKPLHYLPVYEAAVDRFRSRPIHMLEIGVDRGGSLQMWKQYLHPESVMVGIDINPATKQFDDPDRGIHVRIGAQQDVSFLHGVVAELGPFDVILDDGSHMASHLVQTFRYLFLNGLVSGGVYIAEDIGANYLREYRDSPLSFPDFVKSLIDAMHAAEMTGTAAEYFRHQDDQEFRVPLATTLIEKIEFHDSIVVVHRAEGQRKIPSTVYQ